MPEGPECRIIAEGLMMQLAGRTVTSARILSGRYVRHGAPEGFDTFVSKLPLKCVGVGWHGKFIYLSFRSEAFTEGDGYHYASHIWNTLGMSGHWSTSQRDHSRLELIHDMGRVYFIDQRNFGTLRFDVPYDETRDRIRRLGIDLLNQGSLTADDSIEMFSRKRNRDRTLAEVLMDQKCYAGVGNYVKAEALYRACLSPHRIGSSLSEDDVRRLHGAVKEVLHGSYKSNGVTLANYRNLDGEEGEFVRVIYGHDVDPDGHQVIREETKDGRTTHWVPAVQV